VSTDVPFPAVFEDEPDAEGVVGTWFVEDGETVAAGQVIAEVQVEKISQDVEAPAAGVVHLSVAESVGVTQGTVIARIDP
jgi:pyruvate/2-oxoglutarate dehydrogenase complex dihydrolipoamide acyltransferase (E2) component